MYESIDKAFPLTFTTHFKVLTVTQLERFHSFGKTGRQ